LTPDPGTPDPGTPDPGTPDPVTSDPGTSSSMFQFCMNAWTQTAISASWIGISRIVSSDSRCGLKLPPNRVWTWP